MADYTLKNLKDLEDLGAKRGPNVEARIARQHIESEHLGVSLFRYSPGFRAPFGHRHREQEEAYIVVAGSGRIKLDDETVELRQWDVVRVAPRVVRSFEGGPEGLEFIAVGNDRPEGGDGEFVPDFWAN